LVDEQFGFRTKSSTDIASYKLINDVLTSLNDKLLVGGVLQKDFDCVDHDILLSKLKWYGISGKEYKLISLYLKNRYHRVIITNKSKRYYSKWEPTRHVYTVCCCFSFSCIITKMTISISCKRSTENKWMNEWMYFDASRRVIKNFDSKIKGTYLKRC
jgi:hypothetical protein